LDVTANRASILLALAGCRRLVIRIFDEAGNVIETHEHAGDFREP
jgi:hypothetical protein